MGTTRAVWTAVASIALSGLAGGCGEQPGAASVEGFNRAKGVVRVDFEPWTPHELAAQSVIVVYGSVESINDGRVYDNGLSTHTMVIGINPSDVLKDDPGRTGDLVYLEVPNLHSDNLDDLADALPDGTEVALFGRDATDPGADVEGDPDAGREAGSSVYAPFPQGLWFQTPAGLESVLTTPANTGDEWAGIASWDALKRAAS